MARSTCSATARTGSPVEKALTPTWATGPFSARRGVRGFTLIELLVVIAILGILSTFVALSRPRRLAEGTAIAGIEVEGQELPGGALLIFSPASTPLFRITLNAPQGTLVLRSLPNGKVDLQGPGPQ